MIYQKNIVIGTTKGGIKMQTKSYKHRKQLRHFMAYLCSINPVNKAHDHGQK